MHNTSNPDLYIEVFQISISTPLTIFTSKTLHIFEKFNSPMTFNPPDVKKKEIVDAMKKSHESRL